MSYSIVFSSRTGNTARLAEVLRDTLPAADCLYFGPPDESAAEAERIFVGFWTDKGNCDEDTAAFLETLKDSEVFLFGTAGSGRGEAYFTRILDAVKSRLSPSVRVMGSFMCQGKMPPAVLARYENMLASTANPAAVREMIAGFHQAADRPNETDFLAFKRAAAAAMK